MNKEDDTNIGCEVLYILLNHTTYDISSASIPLRRLPEISPQIILLGFLQVFFKISLLLLLHHIFQCIGNRTLIIFPLYKNLGKFVYFWSNTARLSYNSHNIIALSTPPNVKIQRSIYLEHRLQQFHCCKDVKRLPGKKPGSLEFTE